MTDHPITPQHLLVSQWRIDAPVARDGGATREQWIATQAARWGADQELEACCEWLRDDGFTSSPILLRAARRPKPPSLKEQALAALKAINANFSIYKKDADTIRRALEAMSDD